MSIRVFFLLLCCVPAATAAPWDLSVRYRSPAYRADVLDQSLSTQFPVGSFLELNIGGRLSQSHWRPYAFSYLAEFSSPRRHFLWVGARLFHLINTADQLATSQILFHGQFHFAVLQSLHFFLDGGWHTQRTNLNGNTVLPVFSNASLLANNWALRVGFLFPVSESWGGKLWLGTFDDFEAYNLNHPFIQSEISFSDSNRQYTLFARYHFALGFGRLAEFLLGGQVRFNLTTPEPNLLMTSDTLS